MSDTLSPERLFLRYAMPCSFVLCQRGEIEEETVAELERFAAEEGPIDRLLLEKVYFRAFERIGIVAQEMGKDRWDPDVIREYFIVRHNKLIEEGDGEYARAPQTLKDLCRVERATIVGQQEGFSVAKIADGKTRTVITPFLPDLTVGEEVYIHYGYAVERVEDAA